MYGFYLKIASCYKSFISKIKEIVKSRIEPTTWEKLRKNKKALIWILVAFVCLVVAVISGWNYYTRLQARNTQEFIREVGISQSMPRPVPLPVADTQTTEEAEPEPESDDLEPTVPQRPLKPRKPNKREINFDELRKLNPDVIGWIEIPNTRIDYPVVSTLNNQFYVNHDLLGNSSNYGTLFTDILNNPDWEDRFIIIYGHNMRDGSKFADLHYFRNKRFFNNNRTIHIYTPEGQLDYHIFAAYE